MQITALPVQMAPASSRLAMKLTSYHAKYFAHELTKRSGSESVDKLATALSDAQVDLNPHQIEAALFAFRSPLSKGAILADEVGLGKTIEAGIPPHPRVSLPDSGADTVFRKDRAVQRLEHGPEIEGNLPLMAGAPCRNRPHHRLAHGGQTRGACGLFPG